MSTNAVLSAPVLAAEGLIKRFGGFNAVDDVALSLQEGTIHALIGPNGAGKTTCFNLLTKFLTPDAGTIHYRGRDITGAGAGTDRAAGHRRVPSRSRPSSSG